VQHAVELLARGADERGLAEDFLLTGRFPDEHDVGVRWP